VLSAGAQTTGKVPHIGYLWYGAEGSESASRLGLQQGLRELGYHEGRDIVVEYRYADGDVERLRELVSDMVASKIDVIFAAGTIVTDAVKRAATTIPVVATTGDLVGSGFVASLARPGGNITGMSINVGPELGGKWLARAAP
jgi:putative ABC transport system substrate-binding protein